MLPMVLRMNTNITSPEHEKRTWAICNDYWCHQHFDQPYLDDDDDSQDSIDDDDTSQDNSDDDFEPIELDDDTNKVLLDNFMASTAQAGKTRGVDPKHLSKIWRISHEDAQRTIDVTTQMSTRTDDPTLSRNYSTNDRMLRYKRIKDFFFIVEKLQFSFYLISCSQQILNSFCFPGIFPKDCLLTCIFHSL